MVVGVLADIRTKLFRIQVVERPAILFLVRLKTWKQKITLNISQ
jgi:hypothetical protein